ncbi:hypothetical protein J3R30DRAFT_3420894 [Lentinula aciculospora]|uniref:Uncharacterized protein n=1 Tax=Lentinula aciculospora TaxID=153920 RepID=A0A9W9DWY4_9AGAR|nr:hypothetical protein J3R30DRAFT_3420894 [Lentinula aciculospora]
MSKTITIRCELTNHAVWKALSSKPASQTTSVVILSTLRGLSEQLSVPEILPPGVLSGPKLVLKTADEQALVEMDLIAALRKMKGLKHFTWRHDLGPILQEELWSSLKDLEVSSLRIIDYKACDFVGNSTSINYRSIFESSTFWTFTKLTSLELETRYIAGFDIEEDREYLLSLIELLKGNADSLEALNLTFLDPDALVDVTPILSQVTLPRLREITFRRASCTPSALSNFLSAHPSIVSLALSPMMAGRRWEQLSLPTNSLPNLMHLNCSPFHAAKILDGLESSSRPLFSLTGIDVRQVIKLSDYFNIDKQDAYTEDEEVVEVNTEEAEQSITAPWKDELFSRLRSSKQITHVALNENDGPMDLEVLAELMPQIRWIDVGTRRKDATSKGSWFAHLSKFSELRTLHMRGIGVFLNYMPRKEMLSAQVENDIRTLAEYCPKLVAYEDYDDSVIINREGKLSLKVEPRVLPKDQVKDGLWWPSESFVRATTRKNAGPNQPGPAVADVGYN